MVVVDHNSMRKLVEGQLLLLKGDAFQDCMDRLGLELYPGDYHPVRAAGPKGDTKNDGYCPKSRVFFAAHATRGEPISKTKDKISSDLEGCLKHHRDVRVWRFLTNDVLPGEVDQYVDNKLRPQHPGVTIEVWGLKTLADRICKLSRAQVERVIDVNLGSGPQPVRVVPAPEAPTRVRLALMRTGRDLWPILSESLMWHDDEPDGCTEEEEDLVDEALQTFHDWLDISGKVEESRAGVRDAQRDITSILDNLKEKGFVVYAGTHRNLITGGIAPQLPVSMAIFRIVRSIGGAPANPQ